MQQNMWHKPLQWQTGHNKVAIKHGMLMHTTGGDGGLLSHCVHGVLLLSPTPGCYQGRCKQLVLQFAALFPAWLPRNEGNDIDSVAHQTATKYRGQSPVSTAITQVCIVCVQR